jgi:hypothetical protein
MEIMTHEVFKETVLSERYARIENRANKTI